MANDPKLSKLDAAQILRNSYKDDTNELRVAASVTATIGELDVSIDAAAGDNIAIADPTGTNYLEPNPDGSINVVLTDSGLTTKNLCDEVDNVASGVTTEIISYTAIANTKILRCDFGGTNIAMYSLYIAGTLAAKKFTYYQSLNESFEFQDGLPVNAGDQIVIEVVHQRPNPGDFVVNLLIKN